MAEVDEMNLSNAENARFLVYIHESPAGKKYVGITSTSTTQRWGSHGQGYRDNAHFWSAIEKYGWENFKHTVVAENLTLEEASAREVELISKYHAMDPEFGYNQTTGGQWSTPSKEVRQKLSFATRNRSEAVKRKVSESLRGHKVSQETKDKISKANKGNHNLGRGKRSEAAKVNISNAAKGRPSWCKGLTSEDPRVRNFALHMKGKHHTAETKLKLSESAKSRYASGFDTCWVHNDKIEKIIQKIELNNYKLIGFKEGRLPGFVYIHKQHESMKVKFQDVQNYLDAGWELGRPDSVSINIQNARQKYIWILDDNLEFRTSSDLAIYLKDNGYPDIVSSTITNLYNKGFDKSKNYRSLSGRITRRLKDENS